MFAKQRIDDAVSPVVGVILMVAVTVILAAVIGSFVLDLGNNVQANPQAGVTFDQSCDSTVAADDECTVNVQIVSMENADELFYTVSGDANDNANEADQQSIGTGVGQSASISTLSDGSQITVIGNLDGKEAVIQTYTVDY